MKLQSLTILTVNAGVQCAPLVGRLGAPVGQHTSCKVLCCDPCLPQLHLQTLHPQRHALVADALAGLLEEELFCLGRHFECGVKLRYSPPVPESSKRWISKSWGQ